MAGLTVWHIPLPPPTFVWESPSHLPRASAPPLRPGPWRPMTLSRTVHRQNACARAEPSPRRPPHPAHGRVTVAKRHTWQVAMQVAAGRALLYAAQLRRKGRRVTISLPSATTARDLQPARPGETRPRTSHRDIASNNSCKLQQLGTHVTINVDTAITPQRLQHAAGGRGTFRRPPNAGERPRARHACHPFLG